MRLANLDVARRGVSWSSIDVEKALGEFLNEFNGMGLDNPVLILEALKTASTARTFLITSEALRRGLIDRSLAKIRKKEDVTVNVIATRSSQPLPADSDQIRPFLHHLGAFG